MRIRFAPSLLLLLGSAILHAGELEHLSNRLTTIQTLATQRGLSASSPNTSLDVLNTYAQSFDPGSQTFTQEELDAFEDRRNGLVRGFGFTLSSSGSSFAVQGYLEDAPVAGALPIPSVLTHLGTNKLHDLSFCELQALIRQTDTHEVPLTYLTEEGVSNTITLAAGDIQLPAIALAEKLPGGLAYLRLNGLYAGCSRDIVSKIRSWSETDCFGFIIDLRSAGGTDEEAVQGIASLFSSEGEFLYSFRDPDDQDLAVFKAHAGGPISPTVILLTDEQTTGASELLAAVIATSAKRAMIIGTPSAGDPLIRELLMLDENLKIYLASKKVVTQDGTVFTAGSRLMPDILVKSSAAKSSYEPALSIGSDPLPKEIESRMIRDRVRNDPTLSRAVDLLLGLQALHSQPPANS